MPLLWRSQLIPNFIAWIFSFQNWASGDVNKIRYLQIAFFTWFWLGFTALTFYISCQTLLLNTSINKKGNDFALLWLIASKLTFYNKILKMFGMTKLVWIFWHSHVLANSSRTQNIWPNLIPKLVSWHNNYTTKSLGFEMNAQKSYNLLLRHTQRANLDFI